MPSCSSTPVNQRIVSSGSSLARLEGGEMTYTAATTGLGVAATLESGAALAFIAALGASACCCALAGLEEGVGVEGADVAGGRHCDGGEEGEEGGGDTHFGGECSGFGACFY